MYGGINIRGEVTMDYHVFDTAKKEWKSPQMRGDQPTPKERFSLSLYKKNALILFGGMTRINEINYQMCNGIYSLNLQSMTWL